MDCNRDDSIAGIKYNFFLVRVNHQWEILDIRFSFKCHPDRGHTDWGVAYCLKGNKMNLDDCTFNWSILIASLSLLISVFVLLLNFIRYRRDHLIKPLIKCKHEIERFDQTGIRNGRNNTHAQ